MKFFKSALIVCATFAQINYASKLPETNDIQEIEVSGIIQSLLLGEVVVMQKVQNRKNIFSSDNIQPQSVKDCRAQFDRVFY